MSGLALPAELPAPALLDDLDLDLRLLGLAALGQLQVDLRGRGAAGDLRLPVRAGLDLIGLELLLQLRGIGAELVLVRLARARHHRAETLALVGVDVRLLNLVRAVRAAGVLLARLVVRGGPVVGLGPGA